MMKEPLMDPQDMEVISFLVPSPKPTSDLEKLDFSVNLWSPKMGLIPITAQWSFDPVAVGFVGRYYKKREDGSFIRRKFAFCFNPDQPAREEICTYCELEIRHRLIICGVPDLNIDLEKLRFEVGEASQRAIEINTEMGFYDREKKEENV